MSNFSSEPNERLDLPVSTVRPRSAVRERISDQLNQFEGLELSPEDEGFLRLARVVLESEPIPILESAPSSRPCADWGDDGLFS